MRRSVSPCFCINLRRAASAISDFYDRALSGAHITTSQFSLLRDALSLIVGIGILWAFGVMGATVLGSWLGMGLLGVYWAMCIDWYARGICFSWRWLKGKWREKKVI